MKDIVNNVLYTYTNTSKLKTKQDREYQRTQNSLSSVTFEIRRSWMA